MENKHVHQHEHEQVQDHEREHNHAHQREHEQVQDHEREHNHAHQHEHEHAEVTSREEILALLSYMVSHNKHHAEELANLAPGVDGEAALALQKAITFFQEGNQELETALKLMQPDGTF